MNLAALRSTLGQLVQENDTRSSKKTRLKKYTIMIIKIIIIIMIIKQKQINRKVLPNCARKKLVSIVKEVV